MPKGLTKESFLDHLHQSFEVVAPTGQHTLLTLAEVTALSKRPSDQGWGTGAGMPVRLEPFSLVFRGPTEVPLAQGTYRFQHAVMGDQDLFIAPIGMDEQGRYYEAVFT